MLPGRFFKYLRQDKDISAFSYSPIVSIEDKGKAIGNQPIYLVLSDEFIGFYISVNGRNSNSLKDKTLSLNHLLFNIPLNNDLGEKYYLELLETIYDENIEEYSELIYDNPDYRFTGYQIGYPIEAKCYSKAKMFLDFLFDLTHSQVFDSYKNISQIKRIIKNNFLINAIISRVNIAFVSKNIKIV